MLPPFADLDQLRAYNARLGRSLELYDLALRGLDLSYAQRVATAVQIEDRELRISAIDSLESEQEIALGIYAPRASIARRLL